MGTPARYPGFPILIISCGPRSFWPRPSGIGACQNLYPTQGCFNLRHEGLKQQWKWEGRSVFARRQGSPPKHLRSLSRRRKMTDFDQPFLSKCRPNYDAFSKQAVMRDLSGATGPARQTYLRDHLSTRPAHCRACSKKDSIGVD